MPVVFLSLVPVFLLILTGAGLRRLLLTRVEYWLAIGRLVYYVLFPALLIDTLARANLAGVPYPAMAVALTAAILLIAGACLALRPLLAARLHLDGAAFSSVFQGATRWQTFVALAVAGNLYGDAGLALAAVGVVAMIPLLNVINVWVLAHFAGPRRPRWSDVLIAIARNPLIWGCAIGGVLNLLAASSPAAARGLLDSPPAALLSLLGGASLPVGLLAVGSGLTVHTPWRPRAATLLATALKLIVMPAVAITLAGTFGLTGTSVAIVACCASVPSASNAYVLARQMGGDAPLMAEILTTQTLAAIVTMPIVLAVATTSYP